MNYNLLLGIIYCIILVIIIFIGMIISKNMHSKCFRGGKKHKFEPRYTEEETNVISTLPKFSIELSLIYGSDDLRKLAYKQVYKGDVCKWCGVKQENVSGKI